jgi:hypothetical protein
MLKIYFIYKVAGKNPEGLYKIELCRMSHWSPVYVPEIETGRHVKNNACTVEIKIKWMI